MIDLNNTWCEATEENYNEIIKLYDIFYTCDIQDIKYYEFLRNNNGLLTVCAVSLYEEDSKQIHLVNGEFQFVETKPKNNFKEYGFEADFEVEILAVKDDKYFGISKRDELEGWVANGWKKDGTCLYDDVSHLNPIKKEWYENPDNFPCIVMQINCIDNIEIDCGHIIFRNIDDFNRFGGDYRHLTKEEVLALLVKE